MTTKAERVALDAAAHLRSDPLARVTAVHIGMLSIGLPYRSVDPARTWRRPIEGDGLLTLESGTFRDGGTIGIPYGAKARMILFYLQDTAFRQGGRRIELGSSMHAWLRAMHDPHAGGMTYRLVADQARRIATSRYRLRSTGDDCGSAPFIEVVAGADPRSRSPARSQAPGEGFPAVAWLSAQFFDDMIATPVRVSKTALYWLSGSSVALDVYVLLAAHLPRMVRSRTITWEEIAHRFGVGYRDPRRVRPVILKALQLVLAVYSEARVELLREGLLLSPSAAPVDADN